MPLWVCFFRPLFDGIPVGNSLYTNGRDGVESTQTSPNQGGSKKKWVEPAKDGRSCLNCGADISHRLVMVKYCTDRCRLERFYKMRKVKENG
jgi:hypothetical protein